MLAGEKFRRAGIPKARLVALVLLVSGSASPANAVTATVDVAVSLATMPEYGIGLHASVYDNSLRYTGSPYNQLDGLLDAAGVNVLRYPGGGYADVFHFSVSRPGLGFANGFGLSPWWGGNNYGYMGPDTDFGNFVELLDATNSKTIITVNTASAIKYDTPNRLGVPSHNGQPHEAAAWVAYANADASIYGTPADIDLGVDAEGNNWKTAGYWARLRASTPTEFQSWASADGVYDSRNAFLAIDRDEPVGIEYWEIGNENFGTGYYGGGPGDTGYALNYVAPYDGSARDDNPALSPAAYGQEVNDFVAAMKAVDPTIKAGAVLATPPGDYSWSYADLNDNGQKDASEPYWNDEVLSQTDASLGKVADNIDFVVVHWYPWFPQGDNAGILNAPRLTIPRMIHGTTPGIDIGANAGLRDSIAAWRTDQDGHALEILVTETDGAGYEPAIDGLFAADEYVTFFENGVTNVDWLELHNSFLNENNSPQFAYFGIQAVHLLAKVGDEFVATTTSENDVRIHAAQRPDGSVAVMVLNMNTGARSVDITINGGPLADTATRYDTDGDSPLWPTELTGVGNAFSTSIDGRSLQVFVIPALQVLAGDYNSDGLVDTADYTIWRDNLGAAGLSPFDPGDGNGDGLVNHEDYVVWRENFGQSAAAGNGAAALAPEPSALAIGVPLLLAAFWPCQRPRRQATAMHTTRL